MKVTVGVFFCVFWIPPHVTSWLEVSRGGEKKKSDAFVVSSYFSFYTTLFFLKRQH